MKIFDIHSDLLTDIAWRRRGRCNTELSGIVSTGQLFGELNKAIETGKIVKGDNYVIYYDYKGGKIVMAVKEK